MHQTPSANRFHIAFAGRTNAGKSSLINRLSNQEASLVSDIPGTTTDPVRRAIEILPLGPCVLIDTAGLDDSGKLGELRAQKSREVLREADLVVAVFDATSGPHDARRFFQQELAALSIPLLGVVNKSDLQPVDLPAWQRALPFPLLVVSAARGEGLGLLLEHIARLASTETREPGITASLLQPGEVCLLVTPIDDSAPKQRLILPQVQVIRDILDRNGIALITKERELKTAFLMALGQVRLVITDSQVFPLVDCQIPPEIPLTSFSILFARHRGDLSTLVQGALAVDNLRPGDRVLIAEACTHTRQHQDIGQVQIPRRLRQRIGGELDFHWTSGSSYPDRLSNYRLVIHCGGCMISRRQMLRRIAAATDQQVPIVNYGILLAYLAGILPRALTPFTDEIDPLLLRQIAGPAPT